MAEVKAPAKAPAKAKAAPATAGHEHGAHDVKDENARGYRKVRRGYIAEKYGVLVDALYAGKTAQFISTEVKFEDGRRGAIEADLKIAEARTFAAVKHAA